jgi:Ca-activated chloride channel homolog
MKSLRPVTNRDLQSHGAYRQADGQALDILLITDGEVWGVEPILEAARRTPHRCSTIGVGAAVAVDLVQGLADATGGLCTLVHPNENMAEQIVRQFERLRPPPRYLSLSWPQEPLWVWPREAIPGFAGRSLHVFAGFAEPPTGSIILKETLDGVAPPLMIVPLIPWPASQARDVLPRLSAARRLKTLPDEAARELALCHQLISPQTVCLLREQRDADDSPNDTLPELRKIPHLLASGWGGMGHSAAPSASLMMKSSRRDFMAACCDLDPDAIDSPQAYKGLSRPAHPTPKRSPDMYLDRLSRVLGLDHAPDCPSAPVEPESAPTPNQQNAGCRRFGVWLIAQQVRLADLNHPLPGLDELAAAGVPSSIVAALRSLIASGVGESALIAGFLLACAEDSTAKVMQRPARRRLRLALKTALAPEIQSLIRTLIADWRDGDGG